MASLLTQCGEGVGVRQVQVCSTTAGTTTTASCCTSWCSTTTVTSSAPRRTSAAIPSTATGSTTTTGGGWGVEALLNLKHLLLLLLALSQGALLSRGRCVSGERVYTHAQTCPRTF